MRKTIFTALSLILLILLWYIVSFLADTSAIPYFHQVIRHIDNLTLKEILLNLSVSLVRIFIGMILVVIIAVPLGIIMGLNRKANEFMNGFTYLLYPIPKVAFLPVILVLFGIGGMTAVIMVFLVLFFQCLVSVRDSIINVDTALFNWMKTTGATKSQMIYHIILPSIVPSLLTWVRVGLGTSLAVLFFAENIATDKGIGFFILDSWSRIDYMDMYLGIIFLSIAGFILFNLIGLLEKRALRYRKVIQK
ncbi:MAG: ABC transporter permease [Clostridia bacterium]|nr:ABC transporter permease [Clostridia bacterium]